MASLFTRRQFLGAAAAVAASPALVSKPARAAESAWRIGCFTRPWGAYEYTVALDAIAEAGFKYVGLMTTKGKGNFVICPETTLEEAAKIGEECGKRGLAIPSCYGGEIAAGGPLELAVESLKRLIDNCAAAGVKNLLMGGIGQERYETYYKAIAANCDYAAQKGIGISVKPHGQTNANGPECRKVIEFVGHKNFGVWYDPGNIFFYSDAKLNPVDDAATVDGLVMGMSVKDYVHPKKVELTPGTGTVDFPAVMARLKKGGFTSGPLIVECLKPGELPQLLEEAKKARQFVEELVAKI